tara:strand:- start:2475 stop:2942 length:468 start_codon:yes stop_codon:yes gene_type:complete
VIRLEKYIKTRTIRGEDLDSFLYGLLLSGGVIQNEEVVINCHKPHMCKWLERFFQYHRIKCKLEDNTFYIKVNKVEYFYKSKYDLCKNIHPYGYYVLWAFTGKGYEIPFQEDFADIFSSVVGINIKFKKGKLIMDDSMYKSFYHLNAVKGIRNIF